MSSTLRLSSECLLEFKDTYSKSIFDDELYAYVFDTKNIQLLNDDGSINDRDKSYAPYYQNVLLERTPYPLFTDEYQAATALSPHVSSAMPALEYQTVSINFAAGYFYPSTCFGSGIRMYYIVDGYYNITVSALLDSRLSSRLKANERTIVLDNVSFNASYDTEILNMSTLLNSDDDDSKTLVTKMFGEGDHTCSELFIEQFTIDDNNVTDLTINNEYHRKFFVNQINKSYWTKPDVDSNLYVKMVTDTENTCLLIQLLHTKYEIESYMTKKLTYGESWTIEYELTTSAYNFDGEVIGTQSIQLSNFNDTFGEIIYRPVMLEEWMNPSSGLSTDKVDHLLFDIRCLCNTSASSLEITRYNKLIVTNPMIFYIGQPNIEMTTYTAYSKKEQIVHEVNMSTDLPTIVQILKPVYVKTITGTDIELTPYDTNVSISTTGLDTSNMTSMLLKIDTREYYSVEMTTNTVTFTIAASEYLQSTKTYYIFDTTSGQMITYGTISRIE